MSGSDRPSRPSKPAVHAAVRTVGSAAVAAATVLALTAQPAHPAPREPEPGAAGEPGAQSVSQLLSRMRSLYQETEAASEAYNGTEVRLKSQRLATRRAQAALAQAQARLATERVRAGRLARQQYRSSGTGLPPAVQVLLSRDPERLAESGHVLRRAAGGQAATVRDLTSGERRRATLAERAQRALKRQQQLTARKKTQREATRARLKEVEALLASLTGEQLAELRRLETERTGAAQRELEDSGTLGGPRNPSPAGQEALDYAMDQLGKPYRWGAEGPGAFDCSGLTSRAWQHARRAIPRTSQEQWRKLEHVPLHRLRPGDLVMYFSGATHVGIYAGDGKVVQAPRPGAVVKVSPVASNPVLGAVRPDA